MVKVSKSKRGRPKSESAASHDDILQAVYDLLQKTSLRDLTIEAIAKKAKVGKPTIYKWWPTKAAVVLNMFVERFAKELMVPADESAEKIIRAQMTGLIRLLNGFFGKVAAEIIAAGQSEPDVLREYRDQYVVKRREFTAQAIEHAKQTGEFKKQIDPEVLIDMLYGPVYYRLLVKHQPVDQTFGDAVAGHLMTYLKQG